MFGLPFLQKNNEDTEKYIFMLFLSGEKAYGYAFEETNPDNKSSLYQEHIDPFLKDATDKIEKIISNCEADLGQNVYIKRTVLLLNSLYTTESGSIREDFLTQIKKLLKSLDLENLGYINFYEMVLYDFDKKQPDRYLLEESIYDYTVYECKENKVHKTSKIAKTQEEKHSIKEVRKHLTKDWPVIAFFYSSTTKDELKIDTLIKEEDLPKLFTQIYFKENGKSSAMISTKEDQELDQQLETDHYDNLDDLPDAPGFLDQTENFGFKPDETLSEPRIEPKKASLSIFKPSFLSKLIFPKLRLANKLPKLKIPLLLVGGAVLGLLSIPFYLFIVHKANIYLTTKKENFSSKISFVVSAESSFVKEYNQPVSVKVTQTTTGEKVAGEKASGAVTIYNGLFEEQVLESGTQIQTGDGITFLLDSTVTVPSATTSASIGVETIAFGKKNIETTALNIGADGNINDGTKLFFGSFDNDKVYALANEEFKGGFKKTTRVFSKKDADSLVKKATALVKKDIIKEFSSSNSDQDQIYLETLVLANDKKAYSAETGDEIDSVSLELKAKAQVFYSPYEALVKKVQSEKLKDKEFVADTLQLSKISLTKKSKDSYTYSALAKGQVQNFIDKKLLLNKIKGKTVGGAEKILRGEENVTDFTIKTLPISLPLIPFNSQAILFKFNQ